MGDWDVDGVANIGPQCGGEEKFRNISEELTEAQM